MTRKKKLRLYQSIFLVIGFIIILSTYLQNHFTDKEEIISKSLKKKIDKQIKIQNQNKNTENIFYNVKYSGLDFEGNRYTIFSNEAINSELSSELVNMKGVVAKFYFKDNTVLDITSDEGIYNNRTFDIEFSKDVKALYENSELYAEKAEFLNSKNYLIVTDNVKVLDEKGTLHADKLIFDIKEKTLNITSLNNNIVKSKVIYK